MRPGTPSLNLPHEPPERRNPAHVLIVDDNDINLKVRPAGITISLDSPPS